MEKYNFEEHFKILREANDINPSANYGTTHAERITIELLDANYHVVENLNKSTSELKEITDRFDKSSTKLSNRMFALTIATVILALIQVAIGIIQLVK